MSKLPASFLANGFLAPNQLRKRRRLMIGTEGESESGKTEFILSAPGPGIVLCLDRGHEAMLDNPKPPASRRDDYAFKIIEVAMATQSDKSAFFVEYWRKFYAAWRAALENPDALTVGLDTDNASWELQQLAEFGKVVQVPPIMRTSVNAARRAMLARAYDSGKNVIATNMLRDEYKTVMDSSGNPVLKDGKETQEKTGERRRQGFSDTDYLWQVQLRHMYSPAKDVVIGKKTVHNPRQWGIRILKCKSNSELVGAELWGEDATFSGLVQLIYPNVPLKEWGL